MPKLSVPDRFVRLMALASISCSLASGSSDLAQAPTTLDLHSHSWQADGQSYHGIRGTGTVYHSQIDQPHNTIRFVLMPAGWTGDDGAMQEPQLYFGIKRLYIGEVWQELIDLRHGAAYVVLGELEGEMKEIVLHEVRRVAYTLHLKEENREHVPEEPHEGRKPLEPLDEDAYQRSLPMHVRAFTEAVEQYVTPARQAAKAAGVAEPTSLRLFSTMPDETAAQLYWIYWPMIITHSVIAGAEGTRVVVTTLSAEGQQGNGNVHAFVKFIKVGSGNAAVTVPGGIEFPATVDEVMRFDIKPNQEPDKQAPDGAEEDLVQKLQDLMAPGWQVLWGAAGGQ